LTSTAQFYPAANFVIGTKIFLMHPIKRPAPNAPKILGLLENRMTWARNLESSQSSRVYGQYACEGDGSATRSVELVAGAAALGTWADIPGKYDDNITMLFPWRS